MKLESPTPYCLLHSLTHFVALLLLACLLMNGPAHSQTPLVPTAESSADSQSEVIDPAAQSVVAPLLEVLRNDEARKKLIEALEQSTGAAGAAPADAPRPAQ